MQVNLSKKSIDFIIQQEIVSPNYYETHKGINGKLIANPSWPGGDSGVTIGVGYDLGYHTMKEITDDWFNWLKQEEVEWLKKAQGIKQITAQHFLEVNPELANLFIPYSAAHRVFVDRTLPKYIKQSVHIYPGIDKLLPDAIGALVSMVFNRGSSLEGDRRSEMRTIVPFVKDRNYEGIAAMIDQSKRLWQGKWMHGLIARREQEAKLVLNALRQYSNDELEMFEV